MSARRGALRVALVAEGSYPFFPGGVSLWCQQLIHGMPEHTFTAVAITVDGTERGTWPAPDNLAEVVNLPLWGPAPRRARRRAPARFAETHRAFLGALLAARPSGDEFAAVLRELFGYGQDGVLGRALVSNDAVDRLLRAGRDAGLTGLSLRDAVAVADQFEHLLRPLSRPPVRADVCHLAMNGISALVGMTAQWAHGTPVVMSEHGVYLRERYLAAAGEPGSHPAKTLMLRFFRALACAAYRTVDVLAPHSTYNRRWQLYNGADAARMRTMYNGIDPADFPEAGAEPERPTIVFVGRIDPLKDLHTLIRAFALVRERLPDACLRMFGPVPAGNEGYHRGCVRLIDELGLTGAATFEGRVPRQYDAYRAGHLVALTSVSEGFPYTVVESMATGRPQVCTDVGGVSEAVGDAGFVVPPRDHTAVGEACLRLLADAGLRGRLGRLARERVLTEFTLDQWNDAYRAIYADLTRAPEAAASVTTATQPAVTR
ncbi:GT4 family glycosyltransferase PelF [Amycolatopsis anabasis]|uniref:GT4 family glycosyltransferase PelF n=1 Tax=Amycolatopsis anabasis TaxID=1840409 RepID=UPI00131D6029|nr:GT4 family glycosyltransferase PelF [Amycolatopsis anabasis]